MFQAAPSKVIQFVGDTKAEVAKEIQQLAEESVEYVYGSVIRQLDAKGNVVKRYDVHVAIVLEPK